MIYTSIAGSYDSPREDVKCFGDKYLDRFPPRLAAKIYKCLPHLFMPDEEWWIWIDGNLKLKVSEEELIKLAGDTDVCVFENPYRETVAEEKEEILKLGLDTKDNLWLPLQERKLPACFLIIRKNTPEVRRENERWWALISAGSQRDQISFPTAYSTIKRLPKVHPFENKYFTRYGHRLPRKLDTKPTGKGARRD